MEFFWSSIKRDALYSTTSTVVCRLPAYFLLLDEEFIGLDLKLIEGLFSGDFSWLFEMSDTRLGWVCRTETILALSAFSI